MSRVTRVLAFDPGPETSGWAVLEEMPVGRARFVMCGPCDSSWDVLNRLMGEWWLIGTPLVAVETPEGSVHEHARGAMLLKTAAVAGDIRSIARARSQAVLERSAQKWRRSLCPGVRGVPGDREVAAALRVFLADMPKRSNTHTRDAMGLGVIALREWKMERALQAREMGARA